MGGVREIGDKYALQLEQSKRQPLNPSASLLLAAQLAAASELYRVGSRSATPIEFCDVTVGRECAINL